MCERTLILWLSYQEHCTLRQKSGLKNLIPKLQWTWNREHLHKPWCFMHQKNCQTSLIMWLKGYSIILTYVPEISNQSWHTNFGTPCRTLNKEQRSRTWDEKSMLQISRPLKDGAWCPLSLSPPFLTPDNPNKHVSVYATICLWLTVMLIRSRQEREKRRDMLTLGTA